MPDTPLFPGRLGRAMILMDREEGDVTASDVLQVMQEEFDDILTRVRRLEQALKRALKMFKDEGWDSPRGVDPSRWQ